MAFTEEQLKNIKEQIFNQIKDFPKEKQEQIKSFISNLNSEQLEKFLIENKLVKESSEINSENCLFCSIINEKIASIKIFEDEDCIGILEINPLTYGHSLLIPKKHISKIKDLPKKIKDLSNNLGKVIIEKLEANSFKILESDEFGHAVINIIPKYKDKEINQREKADIEELKKISKVIGKIDFSGKKVDKKESKSEISKEIKEEIKKEEPKIDIIKLSRRIP